MAGWCSASPAVQAMPLVGAALSADREQARSYRFWGLGLDCVGWQKPCGSWLASDGIAAVWLPDRSVSGSRASSLLQVLGLGFGWCRLAEPLWELACQRWHRCGLAVGPQCQRIASKLAPTGFGVEVWIVSVGSTLVGAGLPAMASLRSGCRTAVTGFGVGFGLCRLAVPLWELACQRWHHCDLAAGPQCQRIAS